VIDDAKIRWTAPRHADDHMPTRRIYWLWKRLVGPRQMTLLVKFGIRGRFEIGGHLRYPRANRWFANLWVRIVS
jgi:hypothetical protein